MVTTSSIALHLSDFISNSSLYGHCMLDLHPFSHTSWIDSSHSSSIGVAALATFEVELECGQSRNIATAKAFEISRVMVALTIASAYFVHRAVEGRCALSGL